MEIGRLSVDDKEDSDVVDGVYISKSDGGAVFYTQNLVPGQRFHDNEIAVTVGDIEYRVMNPYETNLAVAICCNLRSLYVKPGSVVLYLANDDSSAVTISHLSDIVGNDGCVFVVTKYKTDGDKFDDLFGLRSNVRHLVGADTTNPHQCMECLRAAFTGRPVRIDALYCELGPTDQVDCLSAHASVILKSGGHFVAFIQVRKTVLRTNHEVVVPPSHACLSEMNKLKERGFQRYKASDFGVYKSGWAYIVGWFIGVTQEE